MHDSLVLATTNPDKVREIRALLDGVGVEIVGLDRGPAGFRHSAVQRRAARPPLRLRRLGTRHARHADADRGRDRGSHSGFALPEVLAGDRVTLSTTVGPITVERQVVALQAAHKGANFFVRGSDGAVFIASPQDIRQ